MFKNAKCSKISKCLQSFTKFETFIEEVFVKYR